MLKSKYLPLVLAVVGGLMIFFACRLATSGLIGDWIGLLFLGMLGVGGTLGCISLPVALLRRSPWPLYFGIFAVAFLAYQTGISTMHTMVVQSDSSPMSEKD
jgi:hypothetical protein